LTDMRDDGSSDVTSPRGDQDDVALHNQSHVTKPPRRRFARWVAVAAVGILIGGAGGWAASTVLRPPADVLDETAYTFVEIVRGEVGSSINLNTVAAWSPTPIGSNLAGGVVTSINVVQGQEVGPGGVLYTINLRPTVIAQGDIPAFRTLARGASGADVAQLQGFLTTLGFYSGPIDGGFGSGTESAVESWQESLGLEADGAVQASDLIFTPVLPTRIALDLEVLKRGASVGGGEEVVNGLPAAPTFDIPVTDAQSALIPSGTRVIIRGPNGEDWEAQVLDRESDADGATTLTLEGPDGSAICGDTCADIPVENETLLSSQIVTVEPVAGLVVPSAAIWSNASGETFVTDNDGETHQVEIVTSARGMSVITGVDEGIKVRIPATEPK
jgi:hypothetical protein